MQSTKPARRIVRFVAPLVGITAVAVAAGVHSASAPSGPAGGQRQDIRQIVVFDSALADRAGQCQDLEAVASALREVFLRAECSPTSAESLSFECRNHAGAIERYNFHVTKYSARQHQSLFKIALDPGPPYWVARQTMAWGSAPAAFLWRCGFSLPDTILKSREQTPVYAYRDASTCLLPQCPRFCRSYDELLSTVYKEFLEASAHTTMRAECEASSSRDAEGPLRRAGSELFFKCGARTTPSCKTVLNARIYTRQEAAFSTDDPLAFNIHYDGTVAVFCNEDQATDVRPADRPWVHQALLPPLAAVISRCDGCQHCGESDSYPR